LFADEVDLALTFYPRMGQGGAKVAIVQDAIADFCTATDTGKVSFQRCFIFGCGLFFQFGA